MLERVRHWPLRWKLRVVPLVAVVLLFGAGGGTFFFGGKLRDNQAEIRRTLEAHLVDIGVRQDLERSQGALWQALVCGANSCSQERFDSIAATALHGMDSISQRLEKRATRDDDERTLIDSLRASSERFRTSIAEVLDMASVDASTASTMTAPCEEALLNSLGRVAELASLANRRMRRIEQGSLWMEWMMAGSALMAMLFSIVSVLVLSRWIGALLSRPLQAITGLAHRLAGGDLATPSGVDQSDEIGQVAKAMDTTMQDLRVLIGGVVQSAQALRRDSNSMASAVSSTRSLTLEVGQGLQRLAHEASETHVSATGVLEGAGSISRDVAGISESIATLSDSIAQVAGECRSELVQAESARESARSTTEAMETLRTSAQGVGELLETIHSIMDQTKLLALNATIEAAWAGEYGKGFAVVAQEVKQLAGNTGEVTRQIDLRMEDMLQILSKVERVSDETALSTDRIHASSTNIAHATENHAQVVAEVARLVEGTSREARRVASLAERLKDLAAGIDRRSKELVTESDRGEHASNTLEAVSGELERSASGLQELVGRFRLGG